MRISVSHDTACFYEDQVRASIQYLRLTPVECKRQHILHWELDLPSPSRAQVDPYGNILHVLSLDEPHHDIVIRARGLVDIDPACDAEHSGDSPLPFLRSTRLTQPDDALREFARRHVGSRPDREGLIRLMQALAEHMVYTTGVTRIESTAAEAFAGSAGVCQDHSHVFLACARSLGVPARYVSGYLFSEGSEGLASHAWTEAWFDDAWYTFDVTNGLSRPERHLKLAVGMDYLDACPVRGLRRGGGCEQMHVRLLAEEGVPVMRQSLSQ